MQHLDASEIESINRLVSRGFFSMAFQPIMHTETARPFGFEALLRGPAGTPLADPFRVFGQDGCQCEETITRLDKACIGSAARTGRLLARNFAIFINITCHTILKLSPGIFLNLLAELCIPPDRVVFELSERYSCGQVENVGERLKEFRKSGIRFALDDVGLQRPWLMNLLHLEPDFIKIDRALVSGIEADERKRNLVHGLTFMAEKLDASVIAEGIERPEEHKVLEALGVPFVQGYHYGKPQPAGDWSELFCECGPDCPAILGYSTINRHKA